MSRTARHGARSLVAASSLAVLVALSGASTASALDHKPSHAPQGQANGADKDKDKNKDNGKNKGRDNRDEGGKNAQGGKGGTHGQGGKGGTHGQGGAQGDPAGNNGTVKIAPLGDFDGIPNNTPHPGCTFLVEWFGFDEGADVVSTVTFAMHAPTSDVGLTVDGPSTVAVGGDPATGAGTDTGLDGRQPYTLSFDGAPHPKQGYHVKLTVATPRSEGNDTKTKVFWVAPCDTTVPPVAGGTGEVPGTGDNGEVPGTGDNGEVPGTGDNAVAGTSDNGGASTTDQGVLGAAIGPDDAAPADAADAAPAGVQDSAGVPTSVDAGAGGPDNAVISAVTSPVGLSLIVLGLLAAAGALVLRRRSVV